MMISKCSRVIDHARNALQRIPFFAASTASTEVKNNPDESGFSLIGILAAGLIMTILGVATYGFLSLSGSKSKALFATFTSVAAAAEHYNMSVGAYPTVYGAMVDTNFENDNSTNTNVSTTWNGPYAKDKDMNTSGVLLLNSIATGATLTFEPLTSGSTGALPNGLQYQYALVANNIPPSIAHKTTNICNGAHGNSSGADGGQCVLESGTGGLDTVYYIFAQNQYGAY
ncbi:hypothetical protein HF673_05460 [Acidithiobacillus thiooxidans]|uniref:type II secretion system protein n=1 Tax=Acidithiobacillus thiooxidans TaxID=930 RepID=UPI001C0719B4|nr:hypothetical protein [Acidithiobacillus thiooxidans]MBU2835246.1 hypothetical protein [Acidithiobacillus thiooxidans]